jgi:hypothetical protein
MTTRDHISEHINDRINQRALLLHVLHGIDRASSRKIAAREVAAEDRQRKPNASDTSHRGGDKLYRKLAGILERMFTSKDIGPRPRNAPIDGILTPPSRPVVNKTEPDDVPTLASIVGVYTNNMSGAQTIPDGEFIPRFLDRTTFNWRRSIAENERIERERTEAWQRRLQELRGRQ